MNDEIKCVHIDSRGRKVAYTEAELNHAPVDMRGRNRLARDEKK